MRINVEKGVFTTREIEFIIEQLEQAELEGFITRRKENNRYLLASFKGLDDEVITPKWNVKIYTYNAKRGGHSLVCVDALVLDRLVRGEYESFFPPDLKVLRIDDAGWGFPLCGVMVGISDEHRVRTALVPVEYFRHDTETPFSKRHYLGKYSELAIELLEEFEASPETHRIEICTGYVNQPLREDLRKLGYDVRVVEIKGLLQDELENLYGEHVFKEVGADIYYDPKGMERSEIVRKYKRSLAHGWTYCPDKIKTGWQSIRGG